MYSPTFREPPLPSGPTRRPGQPTSAPSRRPNAPPVHPALNQVKLKHKVTIRDTNCTCQESWPKTITSFLPVPCPATANNAASAKKPAEANETTREADQPGSTAGKGACQGKDGHFVWVGFCQDNIREPWKSGLSGVTCCLISSWEIETVIVSTYFL